MAMNYDFAEAWMPRVNDVLEGRVVQITTGTSEYGDYPIIEIEQENGERRAFHAFHTAARSQLRRVKPAVDDTLGIKYLGRKRSKNAPRGFSAYENYRVLSDRSAFDWDSETPSNPDTDDTDVPF